MKTIIEMAREAGMAGFDGVVHAAFQLEAFAALVRADEREENARVCEKVAVDYYTRIGREHEPYMKATAEDCAMQIRERGQPKRKQEPTCPECKAAVLYECVTCSSNNYPPAQPEERNFCQRCGKPVNLTTIHTCTPPVAADPKAFYGFPQGSVSTPNAGGKCVTAGETAPTKALRKWPSPSAVNDKSLTAR